MYCYHELTYELIWLQVDDMPNDQTRQAAVNPVSKKTHIVKTTKSVEKATKTPVKRSKKTPGPVEKVTDTPVGKTNKTTKTPNRKIHRTTYLDDFYKDAYG